tara:strand:- start:2634 stop:4352 length:1719 start_codon:yes stop_codon:yes gene_type:complete
MKLSPNSLNFNENVIVANELINTINKGEDLSTSHSFYTGIVIEVISNPYDFLNREVGEGLNKKSFRTKITNETEKSESKLMGSLKNSELINYMPMNSIFVNIIDDNYTSDGGKPHLCFPFFSSHIALPLKAGEYVWIIKEDIKGVPYYYWISRKSGFLQSEDVNYTNKERQAYIHELYSDFYSNSGAKKPGDDKLDAATGFNTSSNSIRSTLSQLFVSSNSYRKEFTGEPVPRIAKNCGDLLLQGSNNAGIHITTEKFSKIPEPTSFTNSLTNSDTNALRTPCSGAVDIYVNRKREDLETLKEDKLVTAKQVGKINVVNNTGIDKRLSYYEIDKIADARYQDEDTFSNELKDDESDAVNVAARLYLTSNSNFDQTFGTDFSELISHSGPSAILYGKNTRIVAENSLRLTSNSGNSFIDMNTEGITRIQTSENGKIHLSARNVKTPDNASDMEPYILHSELSPLLKKLGGDVAFLNFIVETLLTAASALPPVGALKQSLEAARASAAIGGAATISVPAVTVEDDDGNVIEIAPAQDISVPTELLGDNINNGNFVSDFSSVVDNNIKSTKIFGE